MNTTLKIDHSSFLTWAVRRSLPYLDAEAANKRIVELEIKLLGKQAEIDARNIKDREAKP